MLTNSLLTNSLLTHSLLILAAMANMAIFGGYLFVATFIAPELKIETRRTRISGVLFFLTCGMTHLDLAFHAATAQPLTIADFTGWYHLPVHIVQAFAVWFFTIGIYQEILHGRISWPLPIRSRRENE